MSNKFDKLPLKKELLENLTELEFHTMTPIQEAGLKPVLSGEDIIAQAKTGSGKTAVFGLGLLNNLNRPSQTIEALVLCPTRELAEQVASEIRSLARMMKNVKVLTICGGTQEFHQESSLAHGADIVVGTPGRVLRLLKKRSLRLSQIQTFVLDEADRMLDMGFLDDIMTINTFLPRERQTLLFSATFPEEIQELGSRVQKDASIVKVDVEHEDSIINQVFYSVDNHKEKNQALLKILAKYQPDRALVFCKTKQITESIAKFLCRNGIVAAGIHGDLMQNDRTAVLTKFSNQSISVLVATDVAARGLDISELAAVINFDLSPDPEVYIHRIGRTGRAGKTGYAISLFLPINGELLEAIELETNRKCIIGKLEDISDEDVYALTPKYKTMYIGGGKKSKLRPGDIAGALTGEAELDFKDIGLISVMNVISYVAIKNEFMDQAISKLRDGKIKNRKFKVGLA